MNRKRGANYIDASERPAVRSLKSRLTRVIAGVAAAVTIFTGIGATALAIDSGTTQHVTSAEAGWSLACGDLIGGNMNERRSATAGNPPLPDAGNRSFTINELVSFPRWTNYTGIGDGSPNDMFVTPYQDVLKNVDLTDAQKGAFNDGTLEDIDKGLETKYSTAWSEVSGKLSSARSTSNCFFSQVFLVGTANLAGLGLANLLQGFVSMVATSVFNAEFFCDPNATSCNGINLVQIVGGNNDAAFQASGTGGGLIGSLTNSIYKPLVIIIVVFTALSIAWQGIVKRQFRQALGMAAWLVLSFIIGLALLLNPNMVAKAPMVATNTIAGCVIGAFNGDNCFDGTGGGSSVSTTPATADMAVCKSSANTSAPHEAATLAVNSMGCSIWRTFILQNYAHGAFGLDLNQLDVANGGTVANEAAVKAGISPSVFCYNLSTNSSFNQARNSEWLQTNGASPQVCNLAVYNLLMQHKITPSGASVGSNPVKFDPAWYDLIVTTASSDQLWDAWTNPGHKFLQGGVAVISVIAAGILIVATSLLALMYYITAVLLLIFAPLFVLVGLHPGRGKKIMLGWMETILSSILKYLASAVFLLVSLAIYSAVIGAASPMVALLFVIILSIVLWMYRKEIVDMFGKVSLGGERLGSMLDKEIPIMGASAKQLGDKAGKLPGALAGGAIGGLAAGGLGGVAKGMRVAQQNELRSTPGLVGRAAQARQSQLQENKSDQSRKSSRAAKRADQAEANAATAGEQSEQDQAAVAEAQHAVDHNSEAQQESAEDLARNMEEEANLTAEIERTEIKLDGMSDHKQASQIADLSAQDALQAQGPDGKAYAAIMELNNSIKDLQLQHASAVRNGDDAGAKRLSDEIRQSTAQSKSQLNDLRDTGISSDRMNEFNDLYRSTVNESLVESGYADNDGNAIKYDAHAHEALSAKNDINNQNLRDVMENRGDLEAINDERTSELNISIENRDKLQAASDVSVAKASAAKVEAASLRTSAETLADSTLDLGPGNLPSARQVRALDKQAEDAANKVRAAHSQAEEAISGDIDPTVLPTQPKKATVAEERAQEARATATNAEERADKATASRVENERTIENSQAEISREERRSRAVAMEIEKEKQNVAEAEKHANELAERLAKVEAEPANEANEKLKNLIERRKAKYEEDIKTAEDKINGQLEKDLSDAEDRIAKANEKINIAQSENTLASVNKTEATAIAERDEAQAARAASDEKAKKQANILSKSNGGKSKDPEVQARLDNLVDAADKLYEARATATSEEDKARIDKLQVSLRNMAEAEKTGKASNVSGNLVNTIDRFIDNLGSTGDPKPSGLPRRPPEG